MIRVMNLSCWVIKVKKFLEINVDNKTYKVQKKKLFLDNKTHAVCFRDLAKLNLPMVVQF